MNEMKILSAAESVCPECLAVIPAHRIARGEDIFLRKTCPRHGVFETVIWRGEPDYTSWAVPRHPAHPEKPFTPVEKGCPSDCGLCPEHRQQPCCVLLEVTSHCDLGCPFCFASANRGEGGMNADPSLETIEMWYRRLLDAGGPFNIQLSGGEPCLREDLPGIISLGRAMGFTFFQVNTNGLRIALDPKYLARLKEAGLSTVYLQFDGTEDGIQQKMRGRSLLEQKITAIRHCAEMEIGVMLVPTVVPGINDHNLGEILRFALAHHPTVRGVHFQPVSYFGRYPNTPTNDERITLPEVIRLLEQQSGGLVRQANFKPSAAENPRCSFHGNFVVMEDGELKALTHRQPQSCCQPVDAGLGRVKAQQFVSRTWAAPAAKPQGDHRSSSLSLGAWDKFAERVRTHGFAISGMAFQDAWTLDLTRLKECYIITVSPDGRLVPFCAYNLTSREGRSLYRNIPAEAEV
jgi:7,8-dihydro-6-hydroxymethylpterin dimethyltransferase